MFGALDQPDPSTQDATFALLRSELAEQTTVVAVDGELDLSTAPRLKSLLVESLDAGSRRIVVDLSRVTFIDSTALAVLVGVNKRLGADVRLAIVWTLEKVLQIFEFSGTDGLFAIFPTLDEALAHVRSGDAAESRG
ncbi:MAG: STAS domain-containing protein [Solirubrobacteraceae bacterium]